jgi:Tfp pilus assembly protein PilO
MFGACAIAYVMFVFLPGQRAIGELNRLRHEKQQHILESTSLVEQLSVAQQRLSLTQTCSRNWRATAPDQAELVATYAGLTEAAQAAGLALRRFDPQSPVEGQLIGEHNLSLEWQGSFPQLFEFIRRLEQLPPTIWVRQFNLAAGNADGETLQGGLTLTIFVDHADNSD